MDDFEKQQLIQLNEIEEIKKTIAGYDKMFNSALQDQRAQIVHQMMLQE